MIVKTTWRSLWIHDLGVRFKDQKAEVHDPEVYAKLLPLTERFGLTFEGAEEFAPPDEPPGPDDEAKTPKKGKGKADEAD